MATNPVEIGLFRHGATHWNEQGRLQGTTDIPLSREGLNQVKSAAKILAETAWDRVLTSPLERARVSAEILAAELSLPAPDIHPALIERSFGIGEGMLYSDWFKLLEGGSPIEGAESDSEVDRRVSEFLRHAEDSTSRKVLVVSHGGFIRRVVKLASGGTLPPSNTRLQNASIQLITNRSGEWQVLDWNAKRLGSTD